MECYFQDLLNIARSIPVQLLSSFFSVRLVTVHVVHPYHNMNANAAWKKLRFILSVSSDFYMSDNLWIAVHAFANHLLMSFSVDETLLPRKLNFSASIKEPLFRVEMSLVWFWLKHIYCVFDMETYTVCCLLQTIHEEFTLAGLFHRVVHIRNILCGVSSCFLSFPV